MKIFVVRLYSIFVPIDFLFRYQDKYDIVGRLLRPGEKGNIYPVEDTTDDGAGYNLHSKKRE